MRRLKYTQSLAAIFLSCACLQVSAFNCLPWVYPDDQLAEPDLHGELKDLYATGLLWEIQSDSGARSYLFGTIHLSDPRVLAAASIAETKIAETENFAMEVLITPDAARLSAQRMFYADGQRLSAQLPPGLFEKTSQLLSNHGVTSDLADRLRPWAAYMTLAVPPANDGKPLDLHLLELAERHRSKLLGIETMEEQLGIFEQLQLSAQISLLTEAVCNYTENQAQVEAMVSLYVRQNLRGLLQMGERYQTPVNTELLERLLFERNKIMAERLKPWIEQGNFFIAVGALHLPGESGLLHSFANQGFELKPILDEQDAD